MRGAERVLPVVVMMLALPWTAWSESRRVFADFDVESYSLAADVVPETAPEQPPDEESLPSKTRPYAYGNFAGGACNHGYTVIGGGGGGEAFPFRRLGLGGDLGFYQFIDDVSFGLYAFNVAVHVGDRSATARIDPYLSLSPGLYTSGGEGGGSLGFGGGLNFWFADRIGLHTDVRLAALGTEEGIVLFRVGVAFR